MDESTSGSVKGTFETMGLADYLIPNTGTYIREGMHKVAAEGTAEETREYFNDIAEHYDEFCETTGRGIGALNLAKIVQGVNPNKEAHILDIACGTGILGIALKSLGYTNVDGLDFAQKMVDLCKSKGIYNNTICAAIEEDKNVTQVDQGSFDVACLNGSMCPGCLTVSHIPVIARLVKPGGHVVFSISAYATNNVPEYKEEFMASKLQSFTESGIFSTWSKGGKHAYYEKSGEEAYAYFATVA